MSFITNPEDRGTGETPRPKLSKGEATRQRLLAAAEDIFGRKGYHHTSVVEITQQAGVAQGTFYLYFSSKLAIFQELVRQLSHELRKESQIAIANVADRREAERIGFQTFFRFVLRHKNLYRIVRECEFVDEELYRWYYRRLGRGYVRGLTRGMEKGQVRRLDPELLACCLMGIGEFLGMWWVLWEDREPPDDVFEHMMEFILRGLDPEPGREPSLPARQKEERYE